MSGTSQYNGRIQFPSSWPDYYAVGPVVGGDWVANGVNHYSDIMAQRRAAWTGCALSGTGYLTITSTVENGWIPMWQSGAFPIPLMPDGTTYRMRLSLAGATSGTNDAVRFAVVLSTPDLARTLVNDGNTDDVWLSDATSSASAAFLSGASAGTSVWSRMVGVSSARAGGYVRSVSTLDGVAGRSVAGRFCMVCLSVFCLQTKNTATPRLYGFTADEWVAA